MAMNRDAGPIKLQKSYELEFSPTGSFVITLSRDVVLWDVAARGKRFRVHPISHPSHCAIDPSGSEIAIKNTAGRIVLIDSEHGRLQRDIDQGMLGEGSNILYSHCGQFLVDGSWNGHVTVRSTVTGSIEFQQEFPNELIRKVAYSPAQDRWWVLHSPKATSTDKPSASDYFSVWSWPLVKPDETIFLNGSAIKTAAISPDGLMLAVVTYSDLSIFRLSDKSLISSTPFVYGGTGFVAVWSPDGLELATVQRGSVDFYSVPGLHKRARVTLEYASDVKYSPDGMLVALGSWNSGQLLEHRTITQME